MDYLERIASDAAMRALIGVARSTGVRPTTLLGDPVVTLNTFNGAGQMVRSETAGWSDEDRQWLAALVSYEARLCPRGHDTTKSTLKELTFEYRAHVTAVCHACHAQDIEAKRWAEHEMANAMLYTPAHLASDESCETCHPAA